jgi:Phasin protein
MAESTSKTPSLLDPEVLLAAQRRNFEAFTSAGKIVAEGMRTCAERQAGMMQEAMRTLWGELKTGTPAPAVANPSDQLARLGGAFDNVLGQVQELSQILLKVQGEAMAVLNDCAAANATALGGMAPDLAGMQKAASGAMQAASQQVLATIEEMRNRIRDLQKETKQATDTAGTAENATAGAERKRGGGAKS